MRPSINTVADHCLSTGLISKDTYNTIIRRNDLVDSDKSRILLSDIQDVISRRAESLQDFIAVLNKIGGFEHLLHKLESISN